MKKWITTGVACTVCGAASADLIIGNLGDVSGGGTLFGSGATTVYKAAGFTMTGDYYLDAVTLTIADATAGSTAHVQIWEGAGAPQVMLADLTDFSFAGHSGALDFTWTPNSQITLDSGTTYWVYLDNVFEPGDSFLWESGSTTPAGPGAVNAGYIFNDNPSSFQNTYAVHGTVVPSPAGLAALGAVCVFARRRR